jgi:hypothetical protein
VRVTEHHRLTPAGADMSIIAGRPVMVRPGSSMDHRWHAHTLITTLRPGGAALAHGGRHPDRHCSAPLTFDAIGTGYVNTNGTGNTCTIIPTAGAAGFVSLSATAPMSSHRFCGAVLPRRSRRASCSL